MGFVCLTHGCVQGIVVWARHVVCIDELFAVKREEEEEKKESYMVIFLVDVKGTLGYVHKRNSSENNMP